MACRATEGTDPLFHNLCTRQRWVVGLTSCSHSPWHAMNSRLNVWRRKISGPHQKVDPESQPSQYTALRCSKNCVRMCETHRCEFSLGLLMDLHRYKNLFATVMVRALLSHPSSVQQGSKERTSVSCKLDGPVFESRYWQKIVIFSVISSGNYSASLSMGTGILFWWYASQSVKLTTHAPSNAMTEWSYI
jgi:hypothetical protein